ncbi:MAG: hypothetical protein ACRDSJ_10750 [Rubrobacteraceae bacterium]
MLAGLIAAVVVAAIIWFALCLNDFILRGEGVVVGRFDRVASIRMTFVISLCVAIPSRLLVSHCRKIQSYASPAEFVFSTLFYVFLFFAMLCFLPALFSG